MSRPSLRAWVVTGLVAAGLIAAAAFALTGLPVPGGSSAGRASTSVSTPATGTATTAPGIGGAENTSVPPGKRYSTEVLPAQPNATPALPPSTALPDPVSAPLPATASASGRLVSGYPEDVLPQAPGSQVSTSSVSSQADRLQVTLDAETDRAVVDVVAFYRTALARYGMYDAPAPAAAGSTSVVFSRDGDAVTLTVTPGARGTSYVLFGAFTAKGGR